MSKIILQACKELIDDSKLGCADLVFKEICLEILYRAKHVLEENYFKELINYASERIKEKSYVEINEKIK